MKNLSIAFILIIFREINSSGQVETIVTGTWKGTSICQVKNSPCHDETVVYRISKAGKANEYSVIMSKMVEGKEEELGGQTFTFDAAKKVLTSIDTDREATWKFDVKGQKMEGTLVYQEKLYRIINIVKEK